ncbi:MAG TPA: Rieske 2Fe-2S domain-containing protein [Candidatus Limnocylindria bacterium]|nr:Rieske 2Fe-2S domain-containing protein [Candidatus Limnocylindria bacterium]
MPTDPLDLDAELARLERIIGTFENETDDAVRERVFELLESVDAVHRRLIWTLAERLYNERAELFDRLLEDPLTSVLFEMYGLVAPSRRAEEGGDAPAAPVAMVGLADLEATIPAPLGWYDAGSADEVRADALVARDVEGERVLLVRAPGGVKAYRDRCPEAPMPLNAAVVRDGLILCPWHDCRFDVETGERRDRAGEGLASIPVTVRDGAVRLGLRIGRRSAA